VPVVETQNHVERPQTPTNNHSIDLLQCIYVVFDLETTGFSPDRNHIIELASEMVDCHGIPIPDSKFSSLVRPPQGIPTIITGITGISDDDVREQSTFAVVGNDFVIYLKEQI
jgi:DNA polymerase III epsilon subunit-like protein